MANYEVIVIGGGPAGLTAGLYASRAGLKSLLLGMVLPPLCLRLGISRRQAKIFSGALLTAVGILILANKLVWF